MSRPRNDERLLITLNCYNLLLMPALVKTIKVSYVTFTIDFFGLYAILNIEEKVDKTVY